MSRELTDAFGRRIDYLRISVTDRCNLRCVYCMPEDGACDFLSGEELLSREEWVRFAEGAALAGIRKIRLTGGEPLMRPDLTELTEGISGIPGIEKVVMTTNGIGLDGKIRGLMKAGLSGVNLSLDSLDPAGYRKIAGRDLLKQAEKGLDACLDAGIPVKINCVSTGGLNSGQWIPLAELAVKRPVQVRFIEMMPIGGGRRFEPVKNEEIRRKIEETFGRLDPAEPEKGQGPASVFTNPSFAGSIGFISAVRHGACGRCGRIRATADGKIKLCLHHPPQGDLRPLLREGASAEQIAGWLAILVKQKPRDGQRTDESRPMWRIGG